ncbi:porin family protein [Flectobacillus major]|jgi:opacity protein-like surface antigen|uniref:porin family protein n=1 Tax=Flectobacillus major TaxID=103 RepID=UPI0004251550|nr:porin family protein [Flectobacillus major]
MKKLFVALTLLLVSSVAVQAQSIAFKGGYSIADVLVSPEPVNVINSKSTFHAGIVVQDWMLSEKVGLQPELLYSLQGFNIGGVGNVGLHYLSLPILVKFPVTEDLSLLAGPQVSYLINTRIGINDLFSIGYNGLFKKIDVGLAGGLEYKINDQFSVGGRYILGLVNINKDFKIDDKSNFSDYFELKNSSAQFYVAFNIGKKK